MADSLANFYPFQGTASSPASLSFPVKCREVTIINDSDIDDLSFKFNSDEDYGILSGGETITIKINTKSVFLNGGGVGYRVWGVG